MKIIFMILLVLQTACAHLGLDSRADIASENCYSYRYGDKLRRINFVEAFDWCHRAANYGDSNSQTLLAELYYLGLGGQQDIKQAEQWFLKAAKQGHAHSQFMLYKIYDFSKHKEKQQQAVFWLKQAQYGQYKLALDVEPSI